MNVIEIIIERCEIIKQWLENALKCLVKYDVDVINGKVVFYIIFENINFKVIIAFSFNDMVTNISKTLFEKISKIIIEEFIKSITK